MPVCRCPSCTQPAVAHGRCQGHHNQWLFNNGRRQPDNKSPGADQATVDKWKQVAGDGDLDERCARIAAALRDKWFAPAEGVR